MLWGTAKGSPVHFHHWTASDRLTKRKSIVMQCTEVWGGSPYYSLVMHKAWISTSQGLAGSSNPVKLRPDVPHPGRNGKPQYLLRPVLQQPPLFNAPFNQTTCNNRPHTIILGAPHGGFSRLSSQVFPLLLKTTWNQEEKVVFWEVTAWKKT